MFQVTDFDENAVQAGGRTSPFLEPGSHNVRLLNIWLEPARFDSQKYHLKLLVEGPEMTEDGFKGWALDPQNPAMGNYIGQIATVQSHMYAWGEFTYKGEVIPRDQQIFNWVMNFAKSIGRLEQMKTMTVPVATIDGWLEYVKPVLCSTKTRIMLTIAGQEYVNQKGYPAISLFIPKSVGKLQPAAPFACTPEEMTARFLPFNAKTHIVAKAEKKEIPVGEFDGAAAGQSLAATTDNRF